MQRQRENSPQACRQGAKWEATMDTVHFPFSLSLSAITQQLKVPTETQRERDHDLPSAVIETGLKVERQYSPIYLS